MKSVLLKIICISFIFSIGCKTGHHGYKQNTPEFVADKFLYHLNHLEFDEAKQYGTEETIKMLDLMQSMVQMIPDQSPPQEVEYNIDRCEIQDNIAICYYTSNGKQDQLELRKIDKKWLVHLSKESITPAPK